MHFNMQMCGATFLEPEEGDKHLHLKHRPLLTRL